MSKSGDRSSNLEAARKTMLNPEGKPANAIIILDDPLTTTPTPELQAKIEEWWDRWLIDRAEGKAIFVGKVQIPTR